MTTPRHLDRVDRDGPASRRRSPKNERDHPGFWRSKAGIVTAAFLVAVAFFLLLEHRAHAFGALPYLIVLACPLLHLFMHRGHGGHGHHGGDEEDGRRRTEEPGK